MKSARVVGSVVLLTLCVTPASADAQSSGTTVEAVFATEAWYQPNPGCLDADLCAGMSPPPSSPYADGTMHVGVTGGTEVARTYLSIAPGEVPGAEGGEVALVVPVDGAAQGSAQPETATMRVCTTAETFERAEGSFDPPPAIDCGRAVPLVYAPGEPATFTASISALGDAASDVVAGSLGLAIVPTASQDGSTWRVVFSAADRPTPPTPPASLVVTLPAQSRATSVPSRPARSTPHATVDLPVPSLPVVPSTTAITSSVDADIVAVPPVGGSAPVTLAASRQVPFQYPAVLLLPAALALLGVALVRILRMDVAPRGDG